MREPADDSPVRAADEGWVIDLTATTRVAEAAQLAVDQLQSVLGGGPWCITERGTRTVLAASGPVDAAPANVVALPAPGLDLVAVEVAAHWREDDDLFWSTIERVGRLLGAVVDAETRAARLEARARQAEELATIDALTGLIDQGEWWRRVAELDAQLHRSTRPVAIGIVDLDDLKEVNDTAGHLEGDALIRRTAERLLSTVRAGDVVARVGGDEFAVLFFDTDEEPDVLADRVTASLADVGIAASVGVRRHRPGSSLRTTYAGADRAMYGRKRPPAGPASPR